MKNVTLLVLLSALALGGCPHKQHVLPYDVLPPGPERPTGEGRGTPIGEACANMAALGCREGRPNRRNATCFEVQSVAAQSAPGPWDCIAKAQTREAVRGCGDPKREITFDCLID